MYFGGVYDTGLLAVTAKTCKTRISRSYAAMCTYIRLQILHVLRRVERARAHSRSLGALVLRDIRSDAVQLG
jgi:hypothetical protein